MDERGGSVDLSEIRRFAAQADAWWQAEGSFRALHLLNPVRLGFIRSRMSRHFQCDSSSLSPFSGLRLLDIGCGGGLVAEPMARLGFSVTAIDAASGTITVAREHARIGGLSIDYRVSTAESIARGGEQFDVVLALEVIEHVADCDTFLRLLGGLVSCGGAAVLSTLNRTAHSFARAIVGAEFVLGWIPPGTHDWRKFVRPSELALGLYRNGLRTTEIAGLSYDLASGQWALSRDLAVNYLVLAVGK